jgi:hypothetical protein
VAAEPDQGVPKDTLETFNVPKGTFTTSISQPRRTSETAHEVITSEQVSAAGRTH